MTSSSASGRKWLSVSLTVALAGGALLSGCSNNNGEAGQTAEQASSQPPSSSGEASKEATPSPEVKKDITVSVYDRGNVAQDEGTIENNRWTKWINENGPANVKFIAIPRTNPEEKINVLYASGSGPDLLFEYAPNNRNMLYDQKQLMPIDDLIEQYSVNYKKLMEDNPILKKLGTKSDGKLYEFGRFNWVNPQRGILIRTDWLEKLNLKMPTTTEELFEVAKAFTEQDPDGNGQKDTFGLSISGPSELTLKQIFGSSNKWVVKDDQLVIDWERRTEYNNYAKRLYDAGIVDRDFAADKNGAKAQQDFINGKLGMYLFQNNNAMSILQTLVDPLKKNVATAEVTFLAYPESEAGAFLPTLGNPVQMTAVVSATAKNPDAVIKYVDFLIEDSTSRTLSYGIEGTHYTMANGFPEILDADKHSKEVSTITADMRMLQNGGLSFSKYDLPALKYQSDPRHDEYQAFYDLFRDTYLTLDKPYPELTMSEHMPSLPKGLLTTDTNVEKSIDAIWLKAVVSGTKYTVEQALKDAQDMWKKNDGQAIEDWYKQWYIDNKDTAMLEKDIKEIVKQQMETYAAAKQELN
ncbi:extracellular solute-binding protein [Cohnella fermenti]|uniref:Extracellular solute-binding protein n=2 Tax=Cohnella fermenti TaxID=2565925 RepID=A0A4V3WDP6_9BACL|nr:extracellular solute-binding protein [Cohnella fermenti]